MDKHVKKEQVFGWTSTGSFLPCHLTFFGMLFLLRTYLTKRNGVVFSVAMFFEGVIFQIISVEILSTCNMPDTQTMAFFDESRCGGCEEIPGIKSECFKLKL